MVLISVSVFLCVWWRMEVKEYSFYLAQYSQWLSLLSWEQFNHITWSMDWWQESQKVRGSQHYFPWRKYRITLNKWINKHKTKKMYFLNEHYVVTWNVIINCGKKHKEHTQSHQSEWHKNKFVFLPAKKNSIDLKALRNIFS